MCIKLADPTAFYADRVNELLVFKILISKKNCRCGGAVFEAEKVAVKNDVYHKRCFTCRRCARAMDSLLVSVAPDGDVYCKVNKSVPITKMLSILELIRSGRL